MSGRKKGVEGREGWREGRGGGKEGVEGRKGWREGKKEAKGRGGVKKVSKEKLREKKKTEKKWKNEE